LPVAPAQAEDASVLFFNPAGIVLLNQSKQGHNLRGTFDAAVDIVSAALNLRWGGPCDSASVTGKDLPSYKK
jgi:hypothetical protein